MGLTTAIGHTPQFAITMGGADITGQFNDRATMIKVQSIDGQGNSDRLDITLDDRDFAIALPATDGEDAATLQLSLGYAQSGLWDQGTFEVNEVRLVGPPRSMQLVGTSQGFASALKVPAIIAHAGKSVAEIINGIAQAAGAEAVVDPAIGDKVVPFLNQHASGMHLLQSLERTYNGVAKFQDGMLSFTQRGTGTSASGVALGTFILTPDDLGSWDIRINARPSYSKVRASWWDKTAHQLQWVTNTTQAAGNVNVPFMIKTPFNSQDEAQSAADATMKQLNRGIVTGSVTLAKGDPSIHAAAPFTISGMRDGIDGSYIVKTATHTYTKKSGIVTMSEFYFIGPTGIDQDKTAAIGSTAPDATPLTTPAASGGIGAA